ncbi:MAG TPA: hypothetical protein VFI22_18595 [Thermomicrobiales bacterium]|nr:hypothetical protein [Thermomicrobiales bacterium]
MSIGWYAIVLIVLAAAAFLYLRDHGKPLRPRQATSPDLTMPPPDFVQDRETSRLAHMSADDRAWEAASLERQRARPAIEHPRGDDAGSG